MKPKWRESRSIYPQWKFVVTVDDTDIYMVDAGFKSTAFKLRWGNDLDQTRMHVMQEIRPQLYSDAVMAALVMLGFNPTQKIKR